MFTRPDWRDPEPYKKLLEPYLTNYTAWEFLRRNPDYQKDYDEFDAEWWGKWFTDDCERYESCCASFESKWGVVQPFNTNGDECEGEWFGDPYFDDPASFKPVGLDGSIKGPRVLLPFDLSKSFERLKFEFDFTVRVLARGGVKQGTIIPRTKRVLSPRRYVEQLRILDAVAAGATVREIGDVLAPSETNDPEERQRDKRIKAAHTAALKMQDGGYRALI
jgi:hypothetical protein